MKTHVRTQQVVNDLFNTFSAAAAPIVARAPARPFTVTLDASGFLAGERDC
jgi:hypothetical protein